MPTTKRRLNISVPREVDDALRRVAARDRVPHATKAAALLRLALEIEEDVALDALARNRDVGNAKFHSHEKAWRRST